MTDEEADKIWQALYRQEHYLMPWSTGEYMVYHHDNPRIGFTSLNGPTIHWEIIHPRHYRLRLFYEDGLIKVAKDVVPKVYVPYKDPYVEISAPINLEDYFEIKDWRGRKIPTALKRIETKNKVERMFKLFIFA